MENSTNSDETYDRGCRPSPSSIDQNDQTSTSETPVYSTMSADSFAYHRTNSETSAFSDPIDDNSSCSEPSPSNWPVSRSGQPALGRPEMRQQKTAVDKNLDDQESMDLELELMKEKFAKLLLGEDMSGSGKGVCTAVTISNAITNLYATVFGQNLRLAPLKPEKKALWKREMDCLLSVCDYVVEFVSESQNLCDGREVEVMASRPRADIYINLPALQKLDTMLMDILESFQDTDFWYAEQGSMSSNSTRSGSFRRVIVQRKEEKWWLPVPCVAPGGLSEKSRKHLRHKRDCANQIHKAAMAINSTILAEMEIPDSYMANLPKSGKACLGDFIYRYMYATEKFSPDHLLDCLSITSEHEALELADHVEASMYTWRRKACMSHSKSSWDMVKDLMSETDRSDKNHLLAARAESLLFCLKQRYPELAQTSLDTCKIQCNQSGKACLGDFIYRYMYATEKFSPDHLLDCLSITSEHEALELADHVEASMYTWRRKACMSHSKSSWDMVKDLMSETDRSDKNHLLAARAESLLFCLKQRYPELAQTSLDTCKIQCNQDVGQAVLESYSRVLEGLAFNIVAWVEDVLFVDRSVRNQDQ